jgi:(1->4)-alpha-D-glucan 1-alpha-D-glucosylmutase
MVPRRRAAAVSETMHGKASSVAREARAPARNAVTDTPVSTYRLQFGAKFRLADAIALVPYLANLGITHVYASPLLKARPGSEHGYDITDFNALNPEIGNWDEFVRFSDRLRANGMGLVLDFVPNHMGIGKADNALWLDVLEAGQSSPFAEFFDIDWTPARRELRGKVLLPMLGAPYGTVLAAGELELRFAAAEGSLSVWYHEHCFPLRARSYAAVIRRQLGRDGPSPPPDWQAHLSDLAGRFDRVRRVARRRRVEARKLAAALKSELSELCLRKTEAAAFMDAAASGFNGRPGDGASFRTLHNLLERQFYRLAYWKVAADEINYRRFFNINELAGVRMENRALFESAHALVGRMIAEGRLDGLRLDHVDGLFDPEAYFRRLRSFAEARMPASSAPGREFYLVAEKILARHEALRRDWPIAGTTGYDFASLVNGVFVDPQGEAALTAAYADFTGRAEPFDAVVLSAKDAVLETMLSGELSVLAETLDRISERSWHTRDYTYQRLRDALKAVVRHFPVYRTYVSPRGTAAEDRRDIEWAMARARREWRGPDREIFDFVHRALLGEPTGGMARASESLRFAMRFQQYTGPIMAKSLEDTAFYRYHRLIALNEVGGDPRHFAVSPAAFHHANSERARHWPRSMTAVATHDTKRGEDARLRIDAVSEIPAEWQRRVARWAELNRSLRRESGHGPEPTRNDEYLLYQTLLGTWPASFVARPSDEAAREAFAARTEQFLIKALREANSETSWDNPNDAYEEAARTFARGLLQRSPNPFLADFSDFAGRIASFAMLSSLSQTVLRLTAPGVADTYQGTETWNLSLVDPDNRAAVDFAGLHAMGEACSATPRGLLETWPDGRIKMLVTRRLMQLRRRMPELFLEGRYEALVAEGDRADHLIAFARRAGDAAVIVLAGRHFIRLLGWEQPRLHAAAWADTRVATISGLAGRWRDILSGAQHALGDSLRTRDILADFPAAVLVRAGD